MEFYILTNNIKEGPYTLEELHNKNINTKTMIWRVGFTNWLPAHQIPELSDMLSSLPPDPIPSLPKTWLLESILVTCFCCLPFGIVGIINATKVENLYNNGNYKLALEQSNQAKKWTLWGFFIMLAFWIIYILIIGIAFIIESM